MQHNNTANTHRSLCALAVVFTSTKWGGCPLIRVCSLIRSNTYINIMYNVGVPWLLCVAPCEAVACAAAPPTAPFCLSAMPTPPPAPLGGLSVEELRALEGEERGQLEARVRCLRDIHTLLDAAMLQIQQYTATMGHARWGRGQGEGREGRRGGRGVGRGGRCVWGTFTRCWTPPCCRYSSTRPRWGTHGEGGGEGGVEGGGRMDGAEMGGRGHLEGLWIVLHQSWWDNRWFQF